MLILLLPLVCLVTSRVNAAEEKVILARSGLNIVKPPVIGRRPKDLPQPKVDLPWERSDVTGHKQDPNSILKGNVIEIPWQPNFSDQDFESPRSPFGDSNNQPAQFPRHDFLRDPSTLDLRKDGTPIAQDGEDIQGFLRLRPPPPISRPLVVNFPNRNRDFETGSPRRPAVINQVSPATSDFPTIGSLLRLLFFGRSSSSAKAKRRNDDIEFLEASSSGDDGNWPLSPASERLLRLAEDPVVNFLAGFSILAIATQQFLTPFGKAVVASDGSVSPGRRRRR